MFRELTLRRHFSGSMNEENKEAVYSSGPRTSTNQPKVVKLASFEDLEGFGNLSRVAFPNSIVSLGQS